VGLQLPVGASTETHHGVCVLALPQTWGGSLAAGQRRLRMEAREWGEEWGRNGRKCQEQRLQEYEPEYSVHFMHEAPLRHGPCSHKIDAQSRYTFRRSVRGSGGEGVDEGMHTEFQRCCRAARAAPRIQPPSGSIYSLGRRAGAAISWLMSQTLRLPTATRRVRSTPRDVNRRRLQNEPCFGVDHRKVTRLPFRRNSCPLARVSCFGTAFGL
jgi:hypothetical protein